jgi:hypothetical protein
MGFQPSCDRACYGLRRDEHGLRAGHRRALLGGRFSALKIAATATIIGGAVVLRLSALPRI